MSNAEIPLMIGLLVMLVQIIVFIVLHMQTKRRQAIARDTAESTCPWTPDPGIAELSQSVWAELSRMPHIVSLVEEKGLVDIVHHTRLYWRCDKGLCLIGLETDSGHPISLSGMLSLTKLLNCHRAIAARFESAH